jgi:hypothetical protein
MYLKLIFEVFEVHSKQSSSENKMNDLMIGISQIYNKKDVDLCVVLKRGTIIFVVQVDLAIRKKPSQQHSDYSFVLCV